MRKIKIPVQRARITGGLAQLTKNPTVASYEKVPDTMDSYLEIAQKVLKAARRPMTAAGILEAAYITQIVPKHLHGRTQVIPSRPAREGFFSPIIVLAKDMPASNIRSTKADSIGGNLAYAR